MPWEIRKSGNRFCVYKKGAKEPLHCYDNEGEAKDYLAALYVHAPESEKKMDDDSLLVVLGGAVKAQGGGRIEGLLVPFGNPEQLDLDGEFFDAGTDFDREFPTKISTYYDHGLDKRHGRQRLTKAEIRYAEDGIWLSDQLDMSDKYHRDIYELAEQKRLYLSSGSTAHLVQKEPAEKGVHITYWPLAEASYTVRPSNPNARVHSLKSWAEVRTPLADPAPAPALSLAERTEQFLDLGTSLQAGFREVAGKELKIGRPVSAARLARMREMHRLLSELIAEVDPRDEVDDGAPGMGAVEASLPEPQEAPARPDLLPPDVYQQLIRDSLSNTGWLEGQLT